MTNEELQLLGDEKLKIQYEWVVRFNKPNAPIIKKVLKEMQRRKSLSIK